MAMEGVRWSQYSGEGSLWRCHEWVSDCGLTESPPLRTPHGVLHWGCPLVSVLGGWSALGGTLVSIRGPGCLWQLSMFSPLVCILPIPKTTLLLESRISLTRYDQAPSISSDGRGSMSMVSGTDFGWVSTVTHERKERCGSSYCRDDRWL